MSEEIKFERKTNLTDDQMIKLLKERQNNALMVHFWPDNSQKTFKILEEPKAYEPKEGEDGKPSAYWKVSWKYKDQPVEILVRTSKTAYDTFMKKVTEENIDYIGKYSIFAKGKSDKGTYHSVSRPMEKAPQEFKDPLSVLQEIEEGKVEMEEDTGVLKKRAADFVSEFMKMVVEVNNQKEKSNEPKIVPTVELASAKYLRQHYREEFDAIRDAF